MADEEYLTADQVAEKLQMAARTVHQLLESGEIPGRKIGGLEWRVSAVSLRAYIEGGVEDVQVKARVVALKLVALERRGEGLSEGTVIRYRVDGVPEGTRAWVGRTEELWQFVYSNGRPPSTIRHGYGSPEDALAALDALIAAGLPGRGRS